MSPLMRENVCILPITHPSRAWVRSEHTNINQTFEDYMTETPKEKFGPLFLPMLVTERWAEALRKDDPATWRACAYLSGFEADVIERAEPDNVLVAALRGIAHAAHDRYMSMMPKSVA